MSRTTKKDYPKKFDSRRFDWSCKHGGSCSYCQDNRLFFDKKARAKADAKEQTTDLYPSEAEEFDDWFDSITR